jgi:hypothetical protein
LRLSQVGLSNRSNGWRADTRFVVLARLNRSGILYSTICAEKPKLRVIPSQNSTVILATQGELDPEIRLPEMREAFRLHAEDVGHIPLYQQSLLWGMKQRVDMIQLPDGVVQVKWVRVN